MRLIEGCHAKLYDPLSLGVRNVLSIFLFFKRKIFSLKGIQKFENRGPPSWI